MLLITTKLFAFVVAIGRLSSVLASPVPVPDGLGIDIDASLSFLGGRENNKVHGLLVNVDTPVLPLSLLGRAIPGRSSSAECTT
ncbi:hypothetical protein PG996_013294 [Apiospora saccharicola]|uniref:Secreted protein n=1 Tax=Apiospora saccharicola TaxID=335842 RepID=A0ABR1U563_9PEZI